MELNMERNGIGTATKMASVLEAAVVYIRRWKSLVHHLRSLKKVPWRNRKIRIEIGRFIRTERYQRDGFLIVGLFFRLPDKLGR